MAKILIVEDDRAILLGLRENLAYEGHAVTEASRGDEALDTVAAVKPDLLILDLMLPGISGLEVRRRIRKNDRRLPNRPDCHRRDAENRCRRVSHGLDRHRRDLLLESVRDLVPRNR
ncbi:MAG: response regulator receiver protein [candidate division NC10 bacterium]|nr:response regulator receiver protein [candidate division NC10 bacterium]